LRRQACKQAFHCGDRGGVAVDRERVEPASEQVEEIPPGATASVEHPPAHVEPSPQQLIEDVDVDVADERTQFG
jgi:hypothetical protein